MEQRNEQAESNIGSTRWKGTQRYQVLARVGEGGMGVVHEAFDNERQQRVALKTLLHCEPATLYQFKREFRTLADVQHKNLVHLHELVIDDAGQAFFTMELVRGSDFVRYVRGSTAPGESNPPANGALEPGMARLETLANIDRLRGALRQLVAGVGALHAAGKLHRDIKPSNVLVTEEGRVVILDFGVAADLSGKGESGANESGEVVGTARYMAPEQCDDVPPTPAADWYSVGVMLFEALVGRPPFGGSVVEVLTMKSNVEPPPPSTFVDGVPVDLDGLCKELLRIDPLARPDADGIRRWLDISASSNPPAAAIAVDQAAAFIGREPQLEALHAAFAAVKVGCPVMVRVVGESGMGKSTVVARFLEELSNRGAALILRGRAYEREAVPFKAVDAAIDALSRRLIDLDEAGELPPLPADMGLLARMFSAFRRVPTIRELPEVPPEEHGSRRRAFRALGELLSSVAGSLPLVLFVDDAHWGDTDSVALLVDLLRRPDASPVMVLLTDWGAAVEETAPFLVEIRNRWPSNAEVRVVHIGPLATDDAYRLALTLLDRSDEASQDIARMVSRESRGSPFLVEELVSSNRASSSGPAAAASGVLTLDQIVGLRLERLPEHARMLVELVAVAGLPLSLPILGQALEIGGALDEAIALGGSRRFTRTGLRDGRDTIEITHNRIREQILAQLSATAARDYHVRLARVFEEMADGEAAAQHWLGAGDPERAVRLAEAASKKSSEKFAFEQSARLLRFTIEHAPASPKVHSWRVRLATILRISGWLADAAREYVAAAASAPRDERIELQRLAAEQLLVSGRIVEGGELLRAVLATVGLHAPRTPRAAFLWLLIYRVWLAVMGLRFKERAPESVSSEDRLRIEALCSVVLGYSMVDSIVTACVQKRHLIEVLRKGDRFHLLRAISIEACHMAVTGKPVSRRERTLFALSRTLAKKNGTLPGHGFVDICLANGLHMRGEWREARTLLTRWTDNAPAGGGLTGARMLAASTCFHMGDVEEAHGRVDRLLVEAEDRGDLYSLVGLRTSIAISRALAADDPERARRGVREALSVWTNQRFDLMRWQAMVYAPEIDLYCGNFEEGYETFIKQLPALKTSYIMRSGFSRATTWSIHGRLAIANIKARPEMRRARIAEARKLAARLEREPDPWVGVPAAQLRAIVENADGNRAGAIEALRCGLARCEATETFIFREFIRYRLGQLLGGEEGEPLVRESQEILTNWGVRRPATYADMTMPGRWNSEATAEGR